MVRCHECQKPLVVTDLKVVGVVHKPDYNGYTKHRIRYADGS